jgi:hypothetical protein
MRIGLLLLATLVGQHNVQLPGGQPLRNIGACAPAIGGTLYTFNASVALPLFTWQVTTVWNIELICKPADTYECDWCIEQQMWWYDPVRDTWWHGGVGELWDQFAHPFLNCGNADPSYTISQYWGNQGIGGTYIEMRLWIHGNRCVDGGQLLEHDVWNYILR